MGLLVVKKLPTDEKNLIKQIQKQLSKAQLFFT